MFTLLYARAHLYGAFSFLFIRRGFGAPCASVLLKDWVLSSHSSFFFEHIGFEAFILNFAAAGDLGVKIHMRNRHIQYIHSCAGNHESYSLMLSIYIYITTLRGRAPRITGLYIDRRWSLYVERGKSIAPMP